MSLCSTLFSSIVRTLLRKIHRTMSWCIFFFSYSRKIATLFTKCSCGNKRSYFFHRALLTMTRQMDVCIFATRIHFSRSKTFAYSHRPIFAFRKHTYCFSVGWMVILFYLKVHKWQVFFYSICSAFSATYLNGNFSVVCNNLKMIWNFT